MSRKIYIYNRAALLYKRGASLRNWMQKVRLHRAAFHFPRASPNVMQPCIFSFVETSIFCPNSIFTFCGNLTIFWQRKESRNLYFATKVTFAFKSGSVFGKWYRIESRNLFGLKKWKTEVWFKDWWEVSKVRGVMSRGGKKREPKLSLYERPKQPDGNPWKVRKHKEKGNKSTLSLNSGVSEWFSDNLGLLHDITIRVFRSRGAQSSSWEGWIAILLFLLPMTDTKDEEIAILVGLI